MVTVTDRRTFGTFTWSTLLLSATMVNFLILTAAGLILGDREPLAMAVVTLVGLVILGSRATRVGAVLLGLLFANVAFWTILAATSNLIQYRGPLPLAMPLSLALTSLTGIVAAFMYLTVHKAPASSVAQRVGLAAIGLFAVVFVVGVSAGRVQDSAARPGDLTLRAAGAAFSATELSAPAGDVTIHLSNGDLFWHTFTIDALGVNEPVPVSGEHTITFKATPGTYTYYCAIPGHAAAGMRGTLTVR